MFSRSVQHFCVKNMLETRCWIAFIFVMNAIHIVLLISGN